MFNADVIFREDCTCDEFIDVIMGNRVYMNCLYVSWHSTKVLYMLYFISQGYFFTLLIISLNYCGFWGWGLGLVSFWLGFSVGGVLGLWCTRHVIYVLYAFLMRHATPKLK